MAATKKAISKAKYDEIKKYLHVPADDAGVMKKFNISQTTTRDIRNTRDYGEYCERRFRYHGYPKRPKMNNAEPKTIKGACTIPDTKGMPMVILSSTQVESEPKKDNTSLLTKVIAVFFVFCLCAAVAALTYKLLCWGFGL